MMLWSATKSPILTAILKNCGHLAYGAIVTITFRSPVNECSNSVQLLCD